MTSTQAFVVQEIRRRHNVPIWIGASLTTLVVAGGAVLAMAALPPIEKPADVAEAYLEARYTGDLSVAWALECAATRFFVGDYSGFVQSSAHWDGPLSLPADVDVAVGDVHEAAQPGGLASISAVVTSPERSEWAITGELPIVVEDGKLRVCDGGLGLG